MRYLNKTNNARLPFVIFNVLSFAAAISSARSDDIAAAERLWRVTPKVIDGKTVCEMTMSGQTPAAGGAYRIHIISGQADPYFIIEHEGDDIAARKASFLVNGKFKILDRDILQQNYDEMRRGIYMQMSRSAFLDQFLPQLEQESSMSMDIKVGRRTYPTVLQGFKNVTRKLYACEKDGVKHD